MEREHEEEYLGALRETLSRDDWMLIVAKQVESALRGHLDGVVVSLPSEGLP